MVTISVRLDMAGATYTGFARDDQSAYPIVNSAVRIVRETGKPIAQVAQELGIKEARWAIGASKTADSERIGGRAECG
jgi:hypothetical protein